MPEFKRQIESAIKDLSGGNLLDKSKRLLNILGYESDKSIALSPNNWEGFADVFVKGDRPFDIEKARVKEWKSIDFVFQLTEDELKRQNNMFTAKKVDNTAIESYLFFTIELRRPHYTRTELSLITREINRLVPMPVMMLFKHGETLTLSVIDRRLHKRDEGRDVLEKVTLIKDIRIDNPHRAHIEILFDLSFGELKSKLGFTNFVELHNAWRKALDTTELNKRFYRELANWYFWAVQNVHFPKDAGADEQVRNATGMIRLITRLIFVWFIKEKGLVRDELFTDAGIKNLLKSVKPKESTYYKAILQNLFFATLNTEMNESEKPDNRIFRRKAKQKNSRDQHYMVHNVYRYEEYFNDPDSALKIFSTIPFLNGGLFECLDKHMAVKGTTIDVRIDGFSDREDNPLAVPNYLFFATEQDVDLNEVYGTRNKSYRVQGLFNILGRYKFTINENTPVEEEVALDPELLGKVFENLLASYNPETSSTARKQTGSFYTPREIVDYMVDESLITYLFTKLMAKFPELKVQHLDERLRHLLGYNDEKHKFTTDEIEVLIDAIDNLKALDPACGSGAFPMGMLHKLVYILSKLDPDNRKWKQKQIDKVSELTDSTMREKLLEDIEQSFQNNELDYGRKLYLIENCIFGVDIQPIAVQIAKLRFFISLIVDQKIDHKKENLGIRPLPNLETKFVAANTLIGIERPAQMMLRNPEIDRKEAELKKVRERHFTARTPKTKEKYRKEDERLRAEISELLKRDGFPAGVTKKLAGWNPYDQNATADFFDPEWMFGITMGFDIAIGNPPYGLLNKRQNQVESVTVTPEQLDYFKSHIDYKPAIGGMINIFKLFILKSIHLLKEGGVFSEIFPLAFIADSSAGNLRSYIFHNCCLQFIEAFPERDNPNKRVFEAAKMSVCIMNLIKIKKKSSFFIRINDNRYIDEKNPKTHLDADLIELLDKTNFTIPLMSQSDVNIISDIYKKSIPLGDIGHCYTGEIDITLGKPYISYDSKDTPLLRGAIIDRYTIRDTMSQGEFLYLKKSKYLKENSGKKATHFQSERIAMQGITGVNEKNRLKMTIIEKGVFCANSINYIIFHDSQVNPKFALGVFNSRLMNYIFTKFSTNSNVNGYEVDNLPYPKIIASNIQQPFITLVDQILAAKQKDPQADTSALEKQIDEMVYKLYGLTEEEIAVVEGKG